MPATTGDQVDTRIHNVLKNEQVTLEQLAERTDEELLSLHNFGKKCLDRVRKRTKTKPIKKDPVQTRFNVLTRRITIAENALTDRLDNIHNLQNIVDNRNAVFSKVLEGLGERLTIIEAVLKNQASTINGFNQRFNIIEAVLKHQAFATNNPNTESINAKRYEWLISNCVLEASDSEGELTGYYLCFSDTEPLESVEHAIDRHMALGHTKKDLV